MLRIRNDFCEKVRMASNVELIGDYNIIAFILLEEGVDWMYLCTVTAFLHFGAKRCQTLGI